MRVSSLQNQNQQNNPSADALEPLLSHEHHDNTVEPSAESRSTTYASIPVESQQETRQSPRNRNRVPPFWVPPYQQSRQQYYIVKVPSRSKPRSKWRAPRPFIIYDYLLSVLFLFLAIRLIQPTRDDISMRAIMGAVLFQAGLVTLVMALYAIFQSCGRRCFQWQDLLTFVALGISIYLNQTLHDPWKLPNMSKAGTWKFFCGFSLLEAVAIYVISRGLFLLPTKDDTIDMLKTEVSSWECSIALGLTSDYYLERIQQVGEVVKQQARANHCRVQVAYQNPAESTDEDSTRLSDEMLVPCVFVAVARYADWQEGSPSPPRRRDFVQSGRLLPCHIEGADLSDKDGSWLCVTGIRQGYILDVSPDPLQTIMSDIYANPKFRNVADRQTQYQREVHRFSQRLAWLLKRDGLDDYVKVIEFESDMMQIPIACKDVFTELQRADDANGAMETPSDEEAGGADTEPSSYQTG